MGEGERGVVVSVMSSLSLMSFAPAASMSMLSALMSRYELSQPDAVQDMQERQTSMYDALSVHLRQSFQHQDHNLFRYLHINHFLGSRHSPMVYGFAKDRHEQALVLSLRGSVKEMVFEVR